MINQWTCLVAYFSTDNVTYTTKIKTTTDNVTYISTDKIKIFQAKVNTSQQHQHKYTKKIIKI